MAGKTPAKGEENLKEKLFSIFRGRNKTASPIVHKPTAKDFIITPQTLKDIGPECPFNNRIRHIKTLSEIVKQKRLEDVSI